MEHLFKILLIIPIIYEFTVACNTKMVHEFVLTYIENRRKRAPKTIYEKLYLAFTGYYMILMIVGLFTNLWMFCLALILLGFIHSNTVKIRLLDAIVSMVILVFAALGPF